MRVFVNQVSVMLSRTSSRVSPSDCPSKTREISCQAARVVIEEISRHADGRIRNPVQCLRPQPHLVAVADALRIYEGELLVRELLVRRETGWRRSAREGSPCQCRPETRQACWCECRAVPDAPCEAITSVMIAPQSPPCATNFVYPRRFISTTQARAMWAGSQPVVGRFARKPVARH